MELLFFYLNNNNVLYFYMLNTTKNVINTFIIKFTVNVYF